MQLKVCFLGAVRRRMFICCRNIEISVSSAARDRNRSATIQTMTLTRSLIPQQHRPIFDQLLVRLSLRQGQPMNQSETDLGIVNESQLLGFGITDGHSAINIPESLHFVLFSKGMASGTP